MLADQTVSLREPWLDGDAVYWLEGRPSEGGRVVLVSGGPWSSPADVTPEGFSVRTTVHEYGGGSYTVSDGVVVFSNFGDQRLYRLEPGSDPAAVIADTQPPPVRRRQDRRRRPVDRRASRPAIRFRF